MKIKYKPWAKGLMYLVEAIAFRPCAFTNIEKYVIIYYINKLKGGVVNVQYCRN